MSTVFKYYVHEMVCHDCNLKKFLGTSAQLWMNLGWLLVHLLGQM